MASVNASNHYNRSKCATATDLPHSLLDGGRCMPENAGFHGLCAVPGLACHVIRTTNEPTAFTMDRHVRDEVAKKIA